MQAIEEGFAQVRHVQVATDEYELAVTCFIGAPHASRTCFEQHVDTMKMELPRLGLEVQHAFHPHELLAGLLHELVDPAIEAIRIEGAALDQRTRLNR